MTSTISDITEVRIASNDANNVAPGAFCLMNNRHTESHSRTKESIPHTEPSDDLQGASKVEKESAIWNGGATLGRSKTPRLIIKRDEL